MKKKSKTIFKKKGNKGAGLQRDVIQFRSDQPLQTEKHVTSDQTLFVTQVSVGLLSVEGYVVLQE